MYIQSTSLPEQAEEALIFLFNNAARTPADVDREVHVTADQEVGATCF
jgi:hypothetical protein